MKKTIVITAHGHELIRSTHSTTFEITKDESLTKRGDCIIGVKSNKAPVDFNQYFKEAARNSEAKITITIEAGEGKETAKAIGDPRLSFAHPTDMVVRRSGYVCSRTIAVKANKASADFSRNLVKKLQNPDQTVKITLTVNTPDL
jgi:hypothetical protein